MKLKPVDCNIEYILKMMPRVNDQRKNSKFLKIKYLIIMIKKNSDPFK